MFSNLVNQTDILSMILPIICCIFAFALPSMGGGGGLLRRKKKEPVQDIESWYTTQNIDKTYEAIEKEVESWRIDTEKSQGEKSGSFTSKIGNSLKRKPGKERFVISNSVKPSLYTISDSIEGEFKFELAEVDKSSTTVKVTYGPFARERIRILKARSPLMIPAAPIGNNCPSCGKPVLRQFIICPYCSQKLKGFSDT